METNAMDLLALLGEEYLQNLGKQVNVDHSVKKLSGLTLLKLLIYNFVSPNKHRVSLRNLANSFKDPSFLLINPQAAGEAVGWTGIRDRLCNINIGYFEKLYEHVLKEATALYDDAELSKYQLKRYDSTLIHTFTHLLGKNKDKDKSERGMKVGRNKSVKEDESVCPASPVKNVVEKRQLKITTEFVNDFQIRFDFHDSQKYLSEETALKELITKNNSSDSNSIVVFDNGLKSRRAFIAFDEAKVNFVTNLGKSPRYYLLHPLVSVENNETDLEIIQDSKVLLYESGNEAPIEHPFRLVEVLVRESGRRLFFLTNIWDLPASEIAQCYRRRWDIEVLFRFLKQEMDLTNMPSYNSNAIKAVLYTKLIVAMLILIFKKKTI